MRRVTSRAVAMTSGAVALPRTISTSRMMLAGLKKCIPTTSRARPDAAAMASMSRVEVFEASTAPARQTVPERSEHLALDRQAFEHGLDHQIRARERLDAAARANALDRGLSGGGIEAPLLDRGAEGAAQPIHAGRQSFRGGCPPTPRPVPPSPN